MDKTPAEHRVYEVAYANFRLCAHEMGASESRESFDRAEMRIAAAGLTAMKARLNARADPSADQANSRQAMLA